ncbi:hypothetical protein [Roseicyclus sp.]|uniref:dioxygenase family protein n=1 Tax=Roseicyclus sp. TaxID=1914329 RepID=UPI003F6CE38A
MPLNRRFVLSLLAALPFSGLSKAALAQRTPAAMEGPFYPTGAMRFADADNNLVRISGLVRDAGGEVIILKGRVLDRAGAPVARARVEIWQCDVNGVYLHTRSRSQGGYDDAFQGFGHVVTGADGVYAFRTIRPTVYPGRTPHIHVKVFTESAELTTQFYLADHPLNASDRLYRSMNTAEREAVSMRFGPGADGPESVVDITL